MTKLITSQSSAMDFPEYLVAQIAAASDLGDPAAQQLISFAVQECSRLRNEVDNPHIWSLLFGAQNLYTSVGQLITNSVTESGRVTPQRLLGVLGVADDLVARVGFRMSVAEICKHLTDPIAAV
ncbi:hypothetical protein [Streptomyces sp. 5-10]|uniref:hypothetical protein n=1 Tax=Streptomyces sp. 5-10 TaxID=878925 RepID=UPI00168AF0AD|nr:hypothetical protein [Streptomyces sp. 5-10]MBD3004711.1 hypothetical protein [Streptomyces sp. 5-10]